MAYVRCIFKWNFDEGVLCPRLPDLRTCCAPRGQGPHPGSPGRGCQDRKDEVPGLEANNYFQSTSWTLLIFKQIFVFGTVVESHKIEKSVEGACLPRTQSPLCRHCTKSGARATINEPILIPRSSPSPILSSHVIHCYSPNPAPYSDAHRPPGVPLPFRDPTQKNGPSPQVPLGWDISPDLPCLWWPWQFRRVIRIL